MTQDYVNGFFTKCAEHKVPYELAVAMYKHAQAPLPHPTAQAPGFFAKRLAPVVNPIKSLVGNATRQAAAQAVMSGRPTPLAKRIDDQARMREFGRTGKMPGGFSFEPSPDGKVRSIRPNPRESAEFDQTKFEAAKKILGILDERRVKKVLALKAAPVEKTPVPVPTK